MKMQRSAGILLPISSLPSPYGIGCFSQEAYDFVDWLKEAGQTYWQILPLGVTSYGDSPYQSFSAFAGNPYFISLDALVEEGALTAAECKKANFGRKADDIDYSRLYTERGRLLRLAYSRSDIGHNKAFAAFCEKNKWWLDDFALFMAVKGRFEGKPWIEWAEDIRLRWQPAMDYYRRELYLEVEYHKYLQFKFDEQWRKLKAYANSKGIQIIGDIPIYVALDSADAWANPGLFQLDKDNIPTAVAGVPPDGFSPTGQLWGNPLYRWETHRATGYQWWITRLWYCFELYDVVRIYTRFNIDHPADFKGHSLSVSDIVVLHQDGKDTAHYCDRFGFSQVPEFLQPERAAEVTIPTPDQMATQERISTPRGSFCVTNMTREQMEAAGYGVHHISDDGKYLIMGNGTRAFAVAAEQPEKDNPLRTVEMTLEDDYGMIDGIINNGRRGEELEKAQKYAERITPEKPSIRERLEDAKRECAEHKPPEGKKPGRDVPEHDCL